MDDYKTQLAYFSSLSAEELARPLWEVPWDQRKAFLSARNRRFFAGVSPDEVPEHEQRVTDWAEVY